MEYFIGTVRIKNPKTLRKWLRTGLYQKRIEMGLIFNPACGRFREETCTCSACRNKKGKNLIDVLNEFGY